MTTYDDVIHRVRGKKLENNGTKPISFRISVEKNDELLEIIKNSSNKYRDRTQFLVVAIDDLILKHNREEEV